VTFPSLRSALLAGALLAFGLSFDEIVVTTFTSSPDVQTLPLWIFGNLFRPNQAPVVNVVAAVLIVLGRGARLGRATHQRLRRRRESLLAPVLARGHPDRAVQAHDLAVEHRVGDDVLDEGRRIPRAGQAASDVGPARRVRPSPLPAAMRAAGVSNRPGAIVITRTCRSASSRAIGNVMPAMPALEAEYPAWPI